MPTDCSVERQTEILIALHTLKYQKVLMSTRMRQTPIHCCSQVHLPKDALQGLFVSSIGDVTILPGFSTAATTISSAFGYGDVYALGFDTQNLATELFG
jgi:hypothetical protein